MLGALFAVLSAATFAMNNAAARRGVVTGTPTQGMAVTVPIGVLCFLLVAAATGQLLQLPQFPPSAAAWMAGVGVVHFVFGRYFNYSANQAAGVNLTAPVVQLQVIVALVLAVLVLHEPCTLLQAIGAALIVAGSLITQRQAATPTQAISNPPPALAPGAITPFVPRHLKGYLFASLAALGYGTTPIMARFALEHRGATSGILGGLIAYGAATAVIGLALLWPPLWRSVRDIERGNIRWFVYSGVFVAMAQGFFYSAVALAPVLVVTPILQLSLVFRLMFSMWLNPHHEVFGPLVLLGVVVSIVGAMAVSIESRTIVDFMALPSGLGHALQWRVR